MIAPAKCNPFAKATAKLYSSKIGRQEIRIWLTPHPHERLKMEAFSMVIRNTLLSIFLGMIASAGRMMAAETPPLQTVDRVELNRYLGKWYEIASFPQWFQKNCVASRATYTLRKDGKVDVLNQCQDKTPEGKLREAKGKAWIVDKQSNAKLKVRFFWPFSGDYWIIDLDADYQYAVVGHPKRNYLWILSRSPQMDSAVYDQIIERLKKQHYDVSRLKKTLQPAK
jgi:apolipoprotein D and lipocalin family protein